MKYDVYNRYNCQVIRHKSADAFSHFGCLPKFTAEIECNETATTSVKLRHAVKWAIENKARLVAADLSWADLSNIDFTGVDLRRADLSHADLTGANLAGVNLHGVDLTGVNLDNAINAPVVIHRLPSPIFVYKDHVVIGCQRIERDEHETWVDKTVDKHWRDYFRIKPIILAVWEHAFPVLDRHADDGN